MNSAASTSLQTLRLKNYRRFEGFAIDFHPTLTVLVAINGGGKSSILDAVAVALRDFTTRIRALSRTNGFASSDVRLARTPAGGTIPVLPTKLDASATIDGRPATWCRERTSLDAKNPELQSDQLTEQAGRLLRELQEYADRRRDEPPTLPVIAYYGTRRDWGQRKRTEATKKNAVKDLSLLTGAYVGCLSPAATYLQFIVWFEKVALEAASESMMGTPSPHRPQQLLAAVRIAVDAVLRPSGWHRIEWDPLGNDVVASHPDHGRLPVSLLSDGIRNLIALVADLAHRAVRLNPHFGEEACRRSPGIVLIDEVDMHLHPAWQQTVVASLLEAFPAMQLIVSTHSHLVVATVPSECVRIIENDGSVSRPTLETQGYDNPFALGLVFGVTDTPPIKIARQLARYRALLEQAAGDSEEGQELRATLVAHFGAQHPAILAADGVKRLQEFKARIASKRGAG